MSKIIKYLYIFILVLLPVKVMSAESINNQEVSSIGTGWGAEGIYVGTVVKNNSGGCGPNYLIEPTHPLIKEMVSILLSAYHTGNKVNLYVNGCFNDGTMYLKAVSILK